MIIRKNEAVERITFGNLYPGDAFYERDVSKSPLMKISQRGSDTPNAVSLDDGTTYYFGGEDYVDLIENIEVVVG